MKTRLVLFGTIILLMALAAPALAQGGADADAVAALLSEGSEALSVGELLMEVDFSRESDWDGFEASQSSGEIVKGVYSMKTNGDIFAIALSGEQYSDVIVQIEASQRSKGESNEYGLLCRANPEYTGEGYYFHVSGDGFYRILKQTEDDVEALAEWTETDAVNRGRADNTITAVCAGSYLAIYVNGELLAEANDDTYAEGSVGFTVGTFEDNDAAEIAFDNMVVWEALAGGGDDPAPSAVVLEDFAGDPGQAVAELRSAGIVGKGGSVLFQEPRAFFSGQGSFFTPLARRSPGTNIVMAAELEFSVGNADEYEECSLMARIETDSGGTATSYVVVGVTNEGEIILVDRFSPSQDSNVAVGDRTVNLDRPVHILFVLDGDRANVFADGELVIADFAVEEREGTYGIALIGRGAGARCEGNNVWVYQLP